jgi:hypothetical protein
MGCIVYVLDVHPEHPSHDFIREPGIGEPHHGQFRGTAEQKRPVGKGTIQVLSDVPAFGEHRSAVLEDRHGLEAAAEGSRNFRKS